MDFVHALKAFASAATVVAAVLVAANWSPRVMVAGFSVFVGASVAWIVSGWIENQPSIYLQNVVLLLVNIFGIYRWLPRVAKAEAPATRRELSRSRSS